MALNKVDGTTIIPNDVSAAISKVATAHDTLDQFELACAAIREHAPDETFESLWPGRILDLVDFCVREEVRQNSKRNQTLNRLEKGPWKLRPCHLWRDLGDGAVHSRNYLDSLREISDVCDYHSAVERLNAARDARREAPKGARQGIDANAERVANDASRVLKELMLTHPAKKRKRDIKRRLTGDERDEPSASDDNMAGANQRVRRRTGARQAGSSDEDDIVEDFATHGDGDSVLDLGDRNASPFTIEEYVQPARLATPAANDASAGQSNHASSPSISEGTPEVAHTKSHNEKAAEAPSMPAVDGEMTEMFSVPASPSEQIPADPLLQGAIRSLESGSWLTTEAVYRAVKLFTPDPLVWYITEPIAATTGVSPSGRGEVRLRLLLDSHQWVVVFVNIDRCHWTVGIIHRTHRTIQIYDPLQNMQYTELTGQTVQNFARRLPVSHRVDSEADKGWAIDKAPTNLQQADGSNCGIYVVVFVAFAMQKEEPPSVIQPAMWREVITVGLKACPGHDLGDAPTVNSSLYGLIPEIPTFEASTFAVDKPSLERFERSIRAMTVRHQEAMTRMEGYTGIGNQVDKLCDAIAAQQSHVEEMKRMIRNRLLLLDEPHANSETFVQSTSLVRMRQLESVKRHVDNAKAKYREAVDVVEQSRSCLKEEAKMAMNREINSW